MWVRKPLKYILEPVAKVNAPFGSIYLNTFRGAGNDKAKKIPKNKNNNNVKATHARKYHEQCTFERISI